MCGSHMLLNTAATSMYNGIERFTMLHRVLQSSCSAMLVQCCNRHACRDRQGVQSAVGQVLLT